jgi:hypothetical protein
MIVVRLELWPRGNKSAKRDLGTMVIENDQTGTEQAGNYMYKIKKGQVYSERPSMLCQGEFRDYPRHHRADAPWELLRGILNQAFGHYAADTRDRN